MNLKDLRDAEDFQRVFVRPLVDAVREEIKPLVENDRRLEERADRHQAAIEELQKQRGRVLAAFAAFTLLLSTAFGLGIDWVRKKLGL